jgi:preprotein translocase subunit SecG
MSLPLALSFMGNLVVGLFILVCLALILIVLLQKGRGGGIGAAFGGGGAGSLLGTKTGDFLTWVTICLVALFLILAVLMGKFMRPTGIDTLMPSAPVQPQVPAGTEQTPAAGEQPAADVEGAVEAVQQEAESAAEAARQQPAPVEQPTEEPAQQ